MLTVNNPVQFVQMMRNPQQLMQYMMSNSQVMQNPISKNALEMYQRGDKQGLNELADNLCKERGIDRKEFEKQIMSQIGMN